MALKLVLAFVERWVKYPAEFFSPAAPATWMRGDTVTWSSPSTVPTPHVSRGNDHADLRPADLHVRGSRALVANGDAWAWADSAGAASAADTPTIVSTAAPTCSLEIVGHHRSKVGQ